MKKKTDQQLWEKYNKKKYNVHDGLNFPCQLTISGNNRRPIRAQGRGAYTPESERPALKTYSNWLIKGINRHINKKYLKKINENKCPGKGHDECTSELVRSALK